ncbi:MAG: trans-aconitate 2-methyltransferase [Dehalococcoidia bacterium]
MFLKSADLYDFVYSQKDYAGEVRVVEQFVLGSKLCPGRRLLDVACGTGRHLELLSRRFTVEGLDLNPELLAVAALRLPKVRFHEADMRVFDLGKTFDVVT